MKPVTSHLFAAALGAALLAAVPAAASAATPCAKSAQSTYLACQLSAGADYYDTAATCQNLASSAQSQCLNQARKDKQDALAECSDQNTERLQVCTQLGGGAYQPGIDPANFTTHIDNPFLPLTPGTTYVYEARTPDGVEHNEVEVTHDTRRILGVDCVVVHDSITLDGALTEDTFDFYAQDRQGNVWYFGEDTRDLEDGYIADIEGAWLSGRDGAQPGIIMEATPAVGDFYRQEFLPSVAEDLARVTDLNASATVPYGSFSGLLRTDESTPLEPGVVESKFYAPGVGTVLEIDDGGVRNELIAIKTH